MELSKAELESLRLEAIRNPDKARNRNNIVI